MTEWANLRDAYGSATNIPTLISAWADAPSDEGLRELWGRLCHQGTVYSASFEAIPLLRNACALLPEKEQRNALILAAAILASNDHHDGATPSEATLKLMPVLERMLTARMRDSDVDAMEFPYLLAAFAAFRGDMFWGRNLDCLASGEFAGACPQCGSPFYLVVGRYGYFATADDYMQHTNAKRMAITPVSAATIPTIGAALVELANRNGRTEAAIAVMHTFGQTNCPICDASVLVPEAIRLRCF